MSPTKRTRIIRKYKLERQKARRAAKVRRKMAAYRKAGFITL